MEILKGLAVYDPAETKVKLHFADGSILEPYGYDSGEHMWFEDGSIYLRIQITSGFTSTLIENLIRVDSNDVTIELSSRNQNINRILSQFDGMKGEVKVIRIGLCSTDAIPSTLIQIILNLPE